MDSTRAEAGLRVLPFVHEGLGNSSYLVGIGDGRALLVDPDRIAARYLNAAEVLGWRIEAVLDTHVHADFVSGARETQAAVGAKVYLPDGGGYRMDHQPVRPGERLKTDGVQVEALASPGHTPEHLSYVVRSAAGETLLFSGGALIVGGAARTDLISPDMTEPLTRAQYQTGRAAFAALPDETRLYPTHGGGSFCSAGGGDQRTSTLGDERRANPVLTFENGEDAFVRWFPSTFPGAPAYFFRMRAMNQGLIRLISDVPRPPALGPDEFDRARAAAVVIDVRPLQAFACRHIPGAVSIPYREAYAVWLGWLAPPETPLLFVTGEQSLEPVVEQSLLVGYERFAGWLKGGIEAWADAGRPIEDTPLVGPAVARRAIADGALALDVREDSEWGSGHIEGARHVALGELQGEVKDLPRDRPIVTYCGQGYRATSAASLLLKAGLGPVLNLDGGIEAWQEAGYRLSLD